MLTTAKSSGVNGQPVAMPVYCPIGPVSNVSYNAAGGASGATGAFDAATEAILVTVTGNCRFQMGATPVAASTTTLLPGPGAYVFSVPKGAGWSAAFLSNDTNTGFACVTELASDHPF